MRAPLAYVVRPADGLLVLLAARGKKESTEVEEARSHPKWRELAAGSSSLFPFFLFILRCGSDLAGWWIAFHFSFLLSMFFHLISLIFLLQVLICLDCA